MPAIHPRSEWSNGKVPVGPLQPEEDVKFLLVHHTASANEGPDKAIALLRSFFAFHTGPEKKWPDIAYNFLVDSGGQIWEGREGSIDGPVRGDATGGSQGHALLCCFIGDFREVSPTPEAIAAMTSLLAWLADRYAVELADGHEVTFTSRGSSRWPAGTTVTTTPIAGHRDMSSTSCPGDVAYDLIASTLRPGARDLVAQARPTPTPSPTPSPPPSAIPTTEVSAGSAASASASGAGATATSGGEGLLTAAIGAAGVAAVGGLSWVLHRRMRGQGR